MRSLQLRERLAYLLADAYIEASRIPKSEIIREIHAKQFYGADNHAPHTSVIEHYVKAVDVQLSGVEIAEILRVFVELERAQQQKQIADNSVGFYRAFLKRIFDAFHNSTHRRTEDRAADALREIGWISRTRSDTDRIARIWSEWTEAIDAGADPNKLELEISQKYGIPDFDNFVRNARRHNYRFSRRPRR